ncbi:MFS transporter [Marinobacter sediminum]|uniref:MFS transporter n=1 Tax=Marinobacter sediminum TaxID=256323 RepID=UPI0019393C3F|nr:MFS transporter [Marinobacter sediminum]
MATLLALYIAQGLPSGLFAHALPVFWREAGIGLAWIGALKLLALPWILKALWAPVIDRSLWSVAPVRWVFGLQSLAALCLIGLGIVGLTPQGPWLPLTVAAILLINLLMATQDVITDGLAVRHVPAIWRGLANTLQVAGYKIGMLAGGAFLLILASHVDTQTALLLPACLLILLLALVFRAPILRNPHPPSSSAGDAEPGIIDGFIGLIRQPGMLFWLGVVACYKVGDAMGSGMVRPMLTDGGWTSEAIGNFTLATTMAGLLGAAIGGWLYTKLGGRRSLIWAGIAQAVTISAWALVAVKGTGAALVYGVGIAEQLADGASTVVLFAMMMNLCRQQWAGTDFTVQASIQVVIAGLFGLLGGMIAQTYSYELLLGLAGCLGLAVVLVFALRSPKTLSP